MNQTNKQVMDKVEWGSAIRIALRQESKVQPGQKSEKPLEALGHRIHSTEDQSEVERALNGLIASPEITYINNDEEKYWQAIVYLVIQLLSPYCHELRIRFYEKLMYFSLSHPEPRSSGSMTWILFGFVATGGSMFKTELNTLKARKEHSLVYLLAAAVCFCEFEYVQKELKHLDDSNFDEKLFLFLLSDRESNFLARPADIQEVANLLCSRIPMEGCRDKLIELIPRQKVIF